MTNEADFLHALDMNPRDHGTRLVFADWLQERDDPRAEAYRALGQLRRAPARWGPYESRTHDLWGWRAGWDTSEAVSEEVLPGDWYALIAHHERSTVLAAERRTRHEAEADALSAFTRLPAERRAELLALPTLPAE